MTSGTPGGDVEGPILALDTALNACALAVASWRPGARPEPQAVREEPLQRGHGEVLFDRLSDVLDVAGVPASALVRIVVTTGPGHFSGARVGLAAARGLGLALGIPVIGVSTLEALLESLDQEASCRVAVIDARQGLAHVQSGTAPSRPALQPLDEIAEGLVGETGPIHLIGSGAPALAERLALGRPTDRPVFVDPRQAVDPRRLLRFAAADPAQRPPHALYLRAPDAVRATPPAWARAR